MPQAPSQYSPVRSPGVAKKRRDQVLRAMVRRGYITQAQAQNRFLNGAFDIAAQIFDRMEIEVLLSTENVDDFEKNMMTIRAEERLALAVYRPEAFVTGQLVPPTT